MVHVSSTHIGEVGLMTYTAASQPLGAMEMICLHFRRAVILSSFKIYEFNHDTILSCDRLN